MTWTSQVSKVPKPPSPSLLSKFQHAPPTQTQTRTLKHSLRNDDAFLSFFFPLSLKLKLFLFFNQSIKDEYSRQDADKRNPELRPGKQTRHYLLKASYSHRRPQRRWKNRNNHHYHFLSLLISFFLQILFIFTDDNRVLDSCMHRRVASEC
jgi:hypothetical protein